MQTRAKAVVLAVALVVAAAVFTFSMLMTCWDRSPCGHGIVLQSLSLLAALAAAVCVLVAVVGRTGWLRHPVSVSLMGLAVVAVAGLGMWTYWTESGVDHFEASGWLVGFRHGWVCYAHGNPEPRCLEGYVPGLQGIVPGDPFRGTLSREDRTGPWRLLVDRAGPGVQPAVRGPGLPVPDATVVRAQRLSVWWAGVRPTDQAPPSIAHVVEWHQLGGPPIGAAFRVLDPVPGLALDVTLTCPADFGVTLWLGGAPAAEVDRADEDGGWVRLHTVVPAERAAEPFHCGPE